jgi:hypothetical protein
MSMCGGGSVPNTGAIVQAAADKSTALANQMYQQERSDLGPWREAGTGAINYLGKMLVPDASGNFSVDPTSALRATPGYNWAMGQGVDARERSAAARGGLLSTPEQKALTTFGQGLADNTYQNYLNNLFNVSGSGQSAATTTGQAGMNYAGMAGQNYLAAANAQAQNALNQYRAQQSGYNMLGSGIGAGLGLLTAPLTGGTSLIGAGINALSNWGGGGYDYGNPGYSSGTDWGGVMGNFGALAEGGPADEGKPYVVGERGPEVFVPTRPGYVVPNYALTVH